MSKIKPTDFNGVLPIASGGTGAATAAAARAALGFDSGVWTPTGTIFSNATDLIPRICHFARIGNSVIFAGAFQITPTVLSPTFCDISLSLPIPSNFTVVDDAWGVVTNNEIGNVTSLLAARLSNDELQISYRPSTTTPQFTAFSGMYLIKA